MPVRQSLLLAGALLFLGRPGPSPAQIPLPGQEPVQEESRSCELIENRWVFIRSMGENNRNTYVSGPMKTLCEGGVEIQADSAVIYEASGYTQLFGNVLFEDPEKQLTADRANYFGTDRRLIALGRGRVLDKVRQSVLTGDTVIYSRARPPYRPQDLLNIRGGQPHAVLFPPEREPEAAPAEAVPDASSGALDATRVLSDSVPNAESDSVAGDPATGATDAEDAVRGSAALGEASDSLPGSTGADVSPDSTEAAPDSAMAESDTPPVDGARPPTPPRRARPTPYDVDAVAFSIVGDREFLAMGEVVIRRDSLEAFGDSLRFDQVSGDIVLTGNARIEEATFDLTGRELRLGETPEGNQEVRAIGDAVLLGDQVDLTAPEIRIHLVEGALDLLVAVSVVAEAEGQQDGAGLGGRGGVVTRTRGGPPTPTASGGAPDPVATDTAPPQPRAITQDFVLTGDSIEVVAPGEVLSTVTAVGRARGESEARDSLNTDTTPQVARRDWLEGNQITAYFEPVDSAGPSATDSTGPGGSVRIDRIVAVGSARSLYRMTPSDTTNAAEPGQLAVHYVLGDTITMTLVRGALEGMTVAGSVRGFHLEPQALAATDTTLADGAQPDSSAIPDTAAATGGGTVSPLTPDTTSAATAGDTLLPARPDTTRNAGRRPGEPGGDVPSAMNGPRPGTSSGEANHGRPWNRRREPS